MFCAYCGHPMPDDGNFCPLCGRAKWQAEVYEAGPPAEASPAPKSPEQLSKEMATGQQGQGAASTPTARAVQQTGATKGGSTSKAEEEEIPLPDRRLLAWLEGFPGNLLGKRKGLSTGAHSNQWRSSIYAGLGAAAGGVIWLVFFPPEVFAPQEHEHWLEVVFGFAFVFFASSKLVEPTLHRLRSGHSSAERNVSLRMGMLVTRNAGLIGMVGAGLELYRSWILHNPFVTLHWTFTGIVVGAITYARIEGLKRQPPRAAFRGAKAAAIAAVISGAVAYPLAPEIPGAEPSVAGFVRTLLQAAVVWWIYGYLGGLVIDKRRSAGLTQRFLLGAVTTFALPISVLAIVSALPMNQPPVPLSPDSLLLDTTLQGIGWCAGILIYPPGKTISPSPTPTHG